MKTQFDLKVLDSKSLENLMERKLGDLRRENEVLVKQISEGSDKVKDLNYIETQKEGNSKGFQNLRSTNVFNPSTSHSVSNTQERFKQNLYKEHMSKERNNIEKSEELYTSSPKFNQAFNENNTEINEYKSINIDNELKRRSDEFKMKFAEIKKFKLSPLYNDIIENTTSNIRIEENNNSDHNY